MLNTVKPEIFTTFLFSRNSRIIKIREIKKSEKFYLFSYLTVKFGVCRAIMSVNITVYHIICKIMILCINRAKVKGSFIKDARVNVTS